MGSRVGRTTEAIANCMVSGKDPGTSRQEMGISQPVRTVEKTYTSDQVSKK